MAHLINVWPSVKARLSRQSRILLFFDYDGTLTPIVSRPEDALLSPDVRQLLAALSANPRCTVGIVSGREIADLQQKIGLPDLIYAGNHGMEIRGRGLEFTHPSAVSARVVLQQACSVLTESLQHITGVMVEDKGLTLTVHYRNTPEDHIHEVESVVADAVAQYVARDLLKLTRGKMVVEVRPDIPWDKGKAIGKIWEDHDDRPFPVYFGDDRTDEDGFIVVQEMGGIAVFVGEPRQGVSALHQLESPEEVPEVLRLILEAMENKG